MIQSCTFLDHYWWSIVFFMGGILQIYPTFASLRPSNREKLKLRRSTSNTLSIITSIKEISAIVLNIFMSLEKCRRIIDFIISRILLQIYSTFAHWVSPINVWDYPLIKTQITLNKFMFHPPSLDWNSDLDSDRDMFTNTPYLDVPMMNVAS